MGASSCAKAATTRFGSIPVPVEKKPFRDIMKLKNISPAPFVDICLFMCLLGTNLPASTTPMFCPYKHLSARWRYRPHDSEIAPRLHTQPQLQRPSDRLS